MLNFDANACYGLTQEVQEYLVTKVNYANFIANPSSIHKLGQNSRGLIENARIEISSFLKIDQNKRLIFTSGASESNTQAILSPYWEELNVNTNVNFVTTAIEHPSVLETANFLKTRGVEVRIVPPNKDGLYSPEIFLEYVDNNTKLISVMYANNETGYIFEVENIAGLVKSKFPNILFHCDGVQALGKIDFSLENSLIDYFTFSGHKIGSLTGVGALVINKDIAVNSLIFGGPQESRHRAGTENVLGIQTLAIACSNLEKKLKENLLKLQKNKELIIEYLNTNFKDRIKINHSNSKTLPNTISLEIQGVNADDFVVALDLDGICISSGSACASGKPLPSHVLLALGKTYEEAKSTIRISFRADLSTAELELFLVKLNSRLNSFVD